MSASDKSLDKLRDKGLLRMLTTKPKRNEELKLGKPRNPRQRNAKNKKKKRDGGRER